MMMSVNYLGRMTGMYGSTGAQTFCSNSATGVAAGVACHDHAERRTGNRGDRGRNVKVVETDDANIINDAMTVHGRTSGLFAGSVGRRFELIINR